MRWRRLVEPAAVLAVWLAGAAVFFREQWTSGFKYLMGNDGDARLLTYLCEHWFRVFHGQDSWLNPGFFYPVKGLLGWSDTFLLYEVFYAPLRLVGAGPFLALQVTVILLSLVGFASFYYLVRNLFGTPAPIALALGLAFTFSNALWLHAGAYQDNGVYLLPVVVLLGLAAWRAATRRLAVLLGAGCGLLFALVLYSTYYVSYFFLLAGAVLLVVMVLAGRRRFVAPAVDGVRVRWATLASGAGAFVVGMVPFALTYLPVRSEVPGTTYAQAMLYAARFHDLADYGTTNVFWSPIIRSLAPRAYHGTFEETYAVTPFLMLGAVVGGALCLAWLLRGRAERPFAAAGAAALGLTAAIVAVLPLHTRFGTPWAVVYHLPGAGAMRAIDRIQIVAGMVACLAVAAAAAEVWARVPAGRLKGWRVAAAAVVALSVGEQVNTGDVSTINRNVQDALVASATAPPASCRSFYVVDPQNPGLPFFEYQVDAMLVSQKVGLPTLNGYTAYDPRGWAFQKYDASYLAGVLSWVELKGVQTGLCQLDLGDMTWQAQPTIAG